jgi:hypothetical protein
MLTLRKINMSNNLNLHIKELGKKEQTKPKVGRKKEITRQNKNKLNRT